MNIDASVPGVSPALIVFLACEQVRKLEGLSSQRRLRLLLKLDSLFPGFTRQRLIRTNFMLADMIIWLRGACHEYVRLKEASQKAQEVDLANVRKVISRAEDRIAETKAFVNSQKSGPSVDQVGDAEICRFLSGLDKALTSNLNALSQFRENL